MKTTIIAIIVTSSSNLVLYSNIDLNFFTFALDVLNSAFQQESGVLNNTLTNGSNINIPKFKESFDILKPIYLDVPNTVQNTIGSWDKILKYPRPNMYYGLNLCSHYIPFLGVGLSIITIMINNGLGIISGRTYSKFKPKTYINSIFNNWYINSVVENAQRDFWAFSSSTNSGSINSGSYTSNNNESDETDNNDLGNNDQLNQEDNNSVTSNSESNETSNVADSDSISESGIRVNTTYPDVFFLTRLNESVINRTQNFSQDLITTNINGNLAGRSITINWNNNSFNIGNLPGGYRELQPRGDTLQNHYAELLDSYPEDESFHLNVEFGSNSMSDIFAEDHPYDLFIQDINNNWRGLYFFINFLEAEIQCMEEVVTGLRNGETNILLFTFSGELIIDWTIQDHSHFVSISQEFYTLHSRKLVVLQLLRTILSHYI